MAEQAGTGTAPADPPNRRRGLVLVVLAGSAGAALVAISAGITWWSANYVDPLTGPLTVTLSGSSCLPELIPLALVGLAGLGAALATGGVARRLIGVVLLVAGVIVATRAALSFGAPPSGLAGSLTRPADPVGEPLLHPVGPALALLGGLLLSAAGVPVLLGVGARRLGARYERTAAPRSPAGAPESAAVDQGDWWKALDSGDDPTTAADPADPTAGTHHDSDGDSDGDVDGMVVPASERAGFAGTDVGTPSSAGSGTTSGSDPIPPVTTRSSAEGTVSDQTSGDGYDDPQAMRRTAERPDMNGQQPGMTGPG